MTRTEAVGMALGGATFVVATATFIYGACSRRRDRRQREVDRIHTYYMPAESFAVDFEEWLSSAVGFLLTLRADAQRLPRLDITTRQEALREFDRLTEMAKNLRPAHLEGFLSRFSDHLRVTDAAWNLAIALPRAALCIWWDLWRAVAEYLDGNPAGRRELIGADHQVALLKDIVEAQQEIVEAIKVSHDQWLFNDGHIKGRVDNTGSDWMIVTADEWCLTKRAEALHGRLVACGIVESDA